MDLSLQLRSNEKYMINKSSEVYNLKVLNNRYAYDNKISISKGGIDKCQNSKVVKSIKNEILITFITVILTIIYSIKILYSL